MTSSMCPECGRPQPGGAPAGMCPNCLLKLGLAGAEADMAVEPDRADLSSPFMNRSFGDYELLNEIARGGMGVVFRARQLSLNRTVAVKLVQGGIFATPAHIKRFKLEAETVARLDHPNIVPIYEVGEHDGQPFFSMRLMEGGTLLEALKRRRFTPREAARLLMELARAVHFAHQRGVLHRDLKPTNVLLDTEGAPHITDFGVAKLLDEQSDLTVTLAVIGTPAYMSPEQAVGQTKNLTTATDIYSLGAILYELLTGRPPFAGPSTAVVLRQVVETEPAPLRKSNPAADPDLEVLCLKCLEKNPARRYGTAAELADELERWLAGRPIQARPISSLERLGRWGRRNPVLGTVSCLLLLSVVTAGFLLTRAYRRTQMALHDSLITQARAQLASKQLGQRFAVITALRQAASIRATDELRSEAAAALARSDSRLISRWPSGSAERKEVTFTPDLKAYFVGGPKGGCELRSAADQSVLRTFRHDKTERRAYSSRYLEYTVLSRDTKRFAAHYRDLMTEIWDLDGSEPLFRFSPGFKIKRGVDFTPDGKSLVAFSKTNGLFIVSLEDTIQRPLAGLTNMVSFLRLNPDGRRIITVYSNAVEVWDMPSGQRVWSLPGESFVSWAAWSHDGRIVGVANARNNDILMLDADSGSQVARLAGHLGRPIMFEFHPGGHWLMSNGRDGIVRVWNIHDGQQLLEALTGTSLALQFSSDGTRSATGAGVDQIGISELSASAVFREFNCKDVGKHREVALASSANGRFLVSASVSSGRVWDVEAGREVAALDRGMPDSHSTLFFGPDDREIIASVRSVATLRIPFAWQNDPAGGTASVTLGTPTRTRVPKNSLLLSIGEDKRSWLVRDGRQGAVFWPEGDRARKISAGKKTGIFQASLSPDHRWSVLAVDPPAGLEVWDLERSRKHSLTNATGARVSAAFFSPDGRWLVAMAHDGHHIWEVATWKHAFHFPCEGAGAPAFAQGGRLLALRIGFDEVELRRMPEGLLLVRLRPPQILTATQMCIKEDGSRLWLLGAGQRLYEWNLTRLRQELASMKLDWRD